MSKESLKDRKGSRVHICTEQVQYLISTNFFDAQVKIPAHWVICVFLDGTVLENIFGTKPGDSQKNINRALISFWFPHILSFEKTIILWFPPSCFIAKMPSPVVCGTLSRAQWKQTPISHAVFSNFGTESWTAAGFLCGKYTDSCYRSQNKTILESSVSAGWWGQMGMKHRPVLADLSISMSLDLLLVGFALSCLSPSHRKLGRNPQNRLDVPEGEIWLLSHPQMNAKLAFSFSSWVKTNYAHISSQIFLKKLAFNRKRQFTETKTRQHQETCSWYMPTTR